MSTKEDNDAPVGYSPPAHLRPFLKETPEVKVPTHEECLETLAAIGKVVGFEVDALPSIEMAVRSLYVPHETAKNLHAALCRMFGMPKGAGEKDTEKRVAEALSNERGRAQAEERAEEAERRAEVLKFQLKEEQEEMLAENINGWSKRLAAWEKQLREGRRENPDGSPEEWVKVEDIPMVFVEWGRRIVDAEKKMQTAIEDSEAAGRKVDLIEERSIEHIGAQGAQLDDLHRQLASREVREDGPNLKILLQNTRKRAIDDAAAFVRVTSDNQELAERLLQELPALPTPNNRALEEEQVQA